MQIGFTWGTFRRCCRERIIIFLAIWLSLPMQAFADCNGEELLSGPVAETSTLSRWTEKVKLQPLQRVSLPYVNSQFIDVQLLRLPMTVRTQRPTQVFLAYIAREVSVIRNLRGPNSFHAVSDETNKRNFLGYYFFLSFASDQDRSEFLAKTFSQVSLDNGNLAAGKIGVDARFGLLLNPEQFLKLSELVGVKKLIADPLMFEAINRDQKMVDFDSLLPMRSGDATYYFNFLGELKALRLGGKLYAYVPYSNSGKKTMASHLQILARQNPNFDISRFDGATPEESIEVGMELARAEVDGIFKDVEEFLQSSGQQELLKSITEQEKNVKAQIKEDDVTAKDLSDRNSSLYFYLTRLLANRALAFSYFNAQPLSDGNSWEQVKSRRLMQSYRMKLSEIPAKKSTDLRFVWIKGLPLVGGGLFFGDEDMLNHEQLLRLALGKTYDAIAKPDLLRGGILRVDRDENGRPTRFTIMEGKMHATINGKVEALSFSDSEKQNFELMLHNLALENLGPK